MNAGFLERHQIIKDALGIVIFVVCVFVGTLLINTYIFRSFNVEGPSSEPTLITGDRLIVNRLPVTIAQLENKPYIPPRGQFIVFKNPQYEPGMGEEYIVKRVLAFAGEHVTLKDGVFKVCDRKNLNCVNPDDKNHGEPTSPTDGSVDTVVPSGELFVVGDHRQAGYSKDSRNGLGTIPYYDVIGPVSLRIYPFDKIRTF